MINRVKRYITFIIENPYFLYEDQTIKDLLLNIEKYNVKSYLVINRNGILKGIVTNRDINSHLNSKNTYECNISDIMTKDLVTATMDNNKRRSIRYDEYIQNRKTTNYQST